MLNQKFNQSFQVTSLHTAEQLGSGLLPVFATPALVALMENTAMQLIDLHEGSSSVGTSICVKHLKASAVCEIIECTATLMAQEGRKYSFELVATNRSGEIIGSGTHERVIVDIERFMSKIK